MAKKNFYVVRSGRQPGIYKTWDECKAQVEGYHNAEYKGFATLGEAQAYLGVPATAEALPAAKPARKPSTRAAAPLAEETSDDAPAVNGVIVYTDGACTGNPGPGGYGAVILRDGHREELSGGFRKTTNNRMEILACIVALQSLGEPCTVTLHSDSQYVVNAMTKGWARRWRSNGWKRQEGYGPNAVWKDALNPDLWEQMLDLCARHKVRFVWVRGHAGNVENERCDTLARQAILKGNLAEDARYIPKSR